MNCRQLGFGAISQRFINGSSPEFTQYTIEFDNPSYTHKVWRSGVENTGTITPPTGYTATWQILNHKTRSVVDSGSGTSVVSTLTFVSMANCNTYDLLVTVTNGSNTFRRLFPAEFTCLPVAPVSFDETWSSAGGHGMGWTDRAGYAIRVTGTISGQVNHWWLKSDDPTDPVHVVLDDCDITSSTWCFTATASKNVIYDGCTDEAIQYGLRVVGTTNNQMIQSTFCEPNNATYRGGWTYWCGISATGDTPSTGVVGFRFIPPNDASNNSTNYSNDGLLMFNCKSQDSWEEGFYIGATNDTLTSGRTYSRINEALFYNIVSDGSGNEAFQMGSVDNWEVFKCHFSNSGTRNQNLHENCFQFAHCDTGYFYMNFIDQGTHNSIAFFQGRTGTNAEFHSNIIYTLGKDGDGAGNIWGRTDNHDTETEIYFSFYKNTIIWTAGAAAFTLYENTDIWNKFWATENIVVGATTTDWENGNGFTTSHVEMENLKKTTANIGDVLFVDEGSKDYHLSSLASPAFASATTYTPTKNSPFKDYDYEGAEWVDDVYGCYSGYELMVDS